VGVRERPGAASERFLDDPLLMSRSRIPPWLKRVLVPFWNGAHRVGWRLGEYLGAVRHGRFGRCDVCGRFGPWLYRRRVIPPRLKELWGLSPRLAEAMARKESSDCSSCGAKLRARRIARVLLDTFPSGHIPERSVAAWVRRPGPRALRVAEINRIEGLHEAIRPLPHLAHSDFTPGAAPGARVNGVRCEDLTRLTYADDSFDLVLTSETLEHVPDLSRALAELHRVLRPGGRHIFTVPLLPGVPRTFARTVVAPDGSLVHRAPQICHPGGDVGYPVFTEFGADLPDLLRQAGFEVEVRFGPTTEDDLAQVFVCTKRGDARADKPRPSPTG
jgi:SAM-dependent methyltransferase